MPRKSRFADRASEGPSFGLKRPLLLCGVAIACVGAVLYAEARIAPKVTLLVSEHGAAWIRRQRPVSLGGWGPTKEQVIFRKRLTARASSHPHVVTVRAWWSFKMSWDGRPIFESDPARESWKEAHEIGLPPIPAAGEHTVEIAVENTFGPSALLAFCDSLDLRTGPDWEEWHEKAGWQPVAAVDQVELPEFSRRFESPARALAATLWWLGPLFVALWGGLIWFGRGQTRFSGLPAWLTASRCRWIVLAAWFVLAANNFTKLPPGLGYDLSGHVDYIRFIVDRGQLPDARDGIEMFQAPLFYVIAAGLDRLLSAVVSSDMALLWLRWVPLLCGMAQVEICFRAGRLIFPARKDLQALMVVVGGLLPMNVYMSQFVSNEPLSGVLTAAVLLWGFQVCRQPAVAERPRSQWLAGLLLGLALLTKMSAALLVPIVAAVLVVANRGRGFRAVLAALARCFGTALLLSGWYYARNWMRFGQPLVGGWDPASGILWWQDPGFRTPRQMAAFGQSLFQPIHAAFYSIWNGFYSTFWLDGNLSSMGSWDSRPPWHQTLLLAAPWPALLLTAAIGAGWLRGLRSPDVSSRRPLQFAGTCLFLYLAAFALFCLEVPVYSAEKASYTLGLTPVFAALCVAGLDLLPRWRVLRSAAVAFVLSWAVLVYGTYFVWNIEDPADQSAVAQLRADITVPRGPAEPG
jgi:hypothetical protein